MRLISEVWRHVPLYLQLARIHFIMAHFTCLVNTVWHSPHDTASHQNYEVLALDYLLIYQVQQVIMAYISTFTTLWGNRFCKVRTKSAIICRWWLPHRVLKSSREYIGRNCIIRYVGSDMNFLNIVIKSLLTGANLYWKLTKYIPIQSLNRT